jgi:uncharacterized protein
MRLAHDILDDLQRALAARPLPRVKALHLPPLATRGRKDGEFGALELDDGTLGLSYVLLGDALGALQADPAHGALQGADALALARQWLSDDPARQALGFAAVNALSRQLFDRAGFVPPPATDSLAGLAPQPGGHVGMVGLFPPLVPQVLAAGARLTVLELRPELAGSHEGYVVTLDPAALAGCDRVLCTSTVLLNHSVDAILAAASRACAVALVGPGAACLPDALFRRGVSTLAGTWITDRAGFLDALARGAPWTAFARKFALPRAGYPGLPALLERSAA